MRRRNWLFDGTAQASVILVRLLVGWVFFSEGVQKFLFPAALGVGRFAKIGIPAPHFFAPFVGVVEIVCGLLVIVGFLTRLAAIPLAIDISVAFATTKIQWWRRTDSGAPCSKLEPICACCWDPCF